MEISALQVVWFLLIAVLWTGYLVLEGFDFGVGMLLPILGRNDKERRVMINTIGPVWDGNEVWVLTAGGATFAAFPEWYATLFSAGYLVLLLILLALIARIVAFEWRGKINDDMWRTRFDWAIIIGSWLPAILWGAVFGNIVAGIPMDADHQFTGNFFTLLTNGNGFALLGGVTTALIFAMHGAIYLSLKTDGPIRERAQKLSATLAMATTVVAALWVIWLQLAYSENAWTWGALVLAALALVATVWFTRQRREGLAFISSAVAILFAVVLIFGSLYPDVLPASNDAGNSLTLANASSSPYTLTVMTWVAVILTPIVLAYQAWTYWVFRKRITVEQIPEQTGLPLAKV